MENFTLNELRESWLALEKTLQSIEPNTIKFKVIESAAKKMYEEFSKEQNKSL
jgi:hypothetical protein